MPQKRLLRTNQKYKNRQAHILRLCLHSTWLYHSSGHVRQKMPEVVLRPNYWILLIGWGKILVLWGNKYSLTPEPNGEPHLKHSDICPGTGLFSCRVLCPSLDRECPCTQDWCPFNKAMRLVLECCHSTPVSCLPFFSGIPRPQECKDQICTKPMRGLRAWTISFMRFFMSRMHLPVSRLEGPSDRWLKTSNWDSNTHCSFPTNLHSTLTNGQLNHQSVPFQGMHGCNSTN